MSHTYLEQKRITFDITKTIEVLLLAGPFIALIGNAASDIWLTLLALYFLFSSVIKNDLAWTKQAWFRLTLLFWFWMLFVSLISKWPDNALEQALTWIRFPVFAAALFYWLGNSEKLKQQMFWSILAGVLLLAFILVVERGLNPVAPRLYGTWTQSPKPGWYMLGLGLPVLLWALSEIKQKTSAVFWGIPLIVLIVSATIATGEVYISIAMLFGCGLFVLFAGFWSWKTLLTGSLCFAAIVGVIASTPRLFERFIEKLITRLPWRETSDYYDPWIGGLSTGFKNFITGVGVDNYEAYCKTYEALNQLNVLGIKKCYPHPHNLYIQTFSETGVIGLLLFIVLVLALVFTILKSNKKAQLNIATITSLVIIFTVLWPISTYSQGFGQHKNLFTWFLIGWALATTHLGAKSYR